LDARDDLEIHKDQQNAEDLLDLDGIYCARIVIECTYGTTNKKEGADKYLALTDLDVDLLTDSEWLTTAAAYSTFATEGAAPIIFDTGASLAIKPDRDIFLEDPTPLRWPMTLGGMANDPVIMGIGKVYWTFPA
jgi:hypothetical protein